MELVHVTTREHTEFIDITDRLAALVYRSGIVEGILNVQTLHTTTAVVVNEHEPLLLTADATAMLERIAPQGAGYHHDDFGRRTANLMPGERANGHAHCRALVLAPSVCLNVADGRLVLGRWQRVLFAELDGPQDRTVSVVIVATTQAGLLRETRPTNRARETCPTLGTVGGASRSRPGDVDEHARDSWIERRFSEALDR